MPKNGPTCLLDDHGYSGHRRAMPCRAVVGIYDTRNCHDAPAERGAHTFICEFAEHEVRIAVLNGYAAIAHPSRKSSDKSPRERGASAIDRSVRRSRVALTELTRYVLQSEIFCVFQFENLFTSRKYRPIQVKRVQKL